jgi:hypothetical protein
LIIPTRPERSYADLTPASMAGEVISLKRIKMGDATHPDIRVESSRKLNEDII